LFGNLKNLKVPPTNPNKTHFFGFYGDILKVKIKAPSSWRRSE